MAHAGLELLAWQRLVNEGRLSNTKFKAMTAEEQVRDLLRVSRIDSALPPALAFLSSSTVIGSPSDGPAAVAELRNRIAHPPRSRRHALLPSDVLVAGWRLANTYLQLVLLRWLRYSGPAISAVDLSTHTIGRAVVRL